jgi:hypothetical protein
MSTHYVYIQYIYFIFVSTKEKQSLKGQYHEKGFSPKLSLLVWIESICNFFLIWPIIKRGKA